MCNKCNSSFSRQDSLNRHKQSHKTKNVLLCQHCSETFATKFLLAKHLTTHNNSQKHTANDNSSQSVTNISLLNNVYPPIIDFKGIGFTNPGSKNLCYINATVNSLLNCKSFKNLINSKISCELLNEIQYSINYKQQGDYST